MISTVAGGVSAGLGGENVPAVGAPLNYPSGVVISPDGTMFVADTSNNRIRKIANGVVSTYATVSSPLYLALALDGTLYVSSGLSQLTAYRVKTDGTVSLFAGNGQKYSYDANTPAQGDGGPATAALFNQITGLAYGADGSVYIGDGNRVRRVGTDGNIITVAGTKSYNVNSAVELGTVEGVAVATDGNIYFRHNGTIPNEITQMTPSGILNHIAGGGNDSSTHCKILPASTSAIHLGYSIAVGNDGSIYFDQDYAVMRIGPDGILTTAAGSCSQSGTYSGDRGAAVGPTIRAVGQGGIALDSTGTKLYITDNGFGGPQGVRLVTVANRQYKVPSDDGSEIYVFDVYGRHESTLDGRTGGTKYSFAYDANGLLASVTAFGSRTTVITQGTEISIQGPYGHLTRLGLDPTTKFLSYIINPNSEQVSFGTDANGLMLNLTDAKQQQHVFAYDTSVPGDYTHIPGKLIRDENPAAGVQTLARSTSLTPGPGLTETVTKTTKLGRHTTYSVEHSGQTQSRTVTMPTGLSSTLTVGADGTRDWQFADGTTVHKALLTDPRFALTAPAVKDYKIVASGVTFEAQTTSRAATCSTAGTCTGGVTCDGTNLTNLINQTDSITINGKSFSAAYVQTCPTGNGGTYTITNTTPGTTSQRYRKLTLDGLGRVAQSEMGGVYPLRFHYDSLGRVDQIAQGTQGGADERIITRTFNPYSPPTTQGSGSGFPATETINDLASDYVQFANYDAAGRTRSITLPGATSPIAVAYDLNGNVSSLTPPAGSAHSFTYDGVDRLANYSPPAIGSPAASTPTRELYDPDQNPLEVGRPDGDSVFVGYDPFGRVSTVTHSLTGFTYAYDSSGRVSGIQTSGPAFGENLQYGYGTAGSVVLDFIRSGAVAGTVHRDLNSFFQPSNETINGANAVSFSYDDDGLLITAGALQLRPDTLSGLLTGTTLGCITDSYSYLHTGQTLSFGEVATYAASSATCSSNQNSSLVSITYDTATNPRDKRGRVIQKQETFNGIGHSFVYAYDTSNRLQSVQRDGTTVESYTYDANGNRLTATNSLNGSSQIGLNPPTYDAQDRLITYPQPAPAGTVNAINYSYTLAGERSVKYVQADWVNHVPPIYNHQYTYYTYDAFGNLVTVILPTGDRIDYIIDGENRRVGKRVNGNLVQGFLYGSASGPVAELNPDGSVRTRFVYGTRANVPDYMIQGTSTYRIITDQLGSVRLVVDRATGAVVQQLDYDAFGNVISATPAYPTLATAIQPFGFAGGLYDADTKLVRFGARDYDPEVGRWLSKDPLRFGGGDANLYAYSTNDPVNLVDPRGLDVQISSEFAGALATAMQDPFFASTLAALQSDHTVLVTVQPIQNDNDVELAYNNGGAFTQHLETAMCSTYGSVSRIIIDDGYGAQRWGREWLTAGALAHEIGHAFWDPFVGGNAHPWAQATENGVRDVVGMTPRTLEYQQ